MLTYDCIFRRVEGMPDSDAEVWKEVPGIRLSDTVTGEEPPLATSVQAYWNENGMVVRFVGEDSGIVAEMTAHDDDLYEEDVLELFLADTGDLRTYKELEVSPANVRFDARIVNDGSGRVEVEREWHAEGWITKTEADVCKLSSVWFIPWTAFDGQQPAAGDSWRVNVYRIDRGSEPSKDLYMAWSPTEAVNFHLPEKFGCWRFVNT